MIWKVVWSKNCHKSFNEIQRWSIEVHHSSRFSDLLYKNTTQCHHQLGGITLRDPRHPTQQPPIMIIDLTLCKHSIWIATYKSSGILDHKPNHESSATQLTPACKDLTHGTNSWGRDLMSLMGKPITFKDRCIRARTYLIRSRTSSVRVPNKPTISIWCPFRPKCTINKLKIELWNKPLRWRCNKQISKNYSASLNRTTSHWDRIKSGWWVMASTSTKTSKHNWSSPRNSSQL